MSSPKISIYDKKIEINEKTPENPIAIVNSGMEPFSQSNGLVACFCKKSADMVSFLSVT